jgi:DNA-binding beta-propeller fold protein YncE
VYVTDSGNNRIEKLSPTGKTLAVWNRPGKGTAPFSNPTGIAVGANGTIYVADTGNNRIVALSPQGKMLKTWTGNGSRSAGRPATVLPIVALGKALAAPRGVAVDAAGNLYVADAGNNRILELSAAGRVIHAWGSRGARPGQFEGPAGVTIDATGNVLVADTGNNRVQVLKRNG